MKRRGWQWFGGVQVVGICCSLIPGLSFFRYFGGLLLLPGSLLPWLESELMKDPVSSHGTGSQVVILIAALVVNALTWRSVAQVLREQGLT